MFIQRIFQKFGQVRVRRVGFILRSRFLGCCFNGHAEWGVFFFYLSDCFFRERGILFSSYIKLTLETSLFTLLLTEDDVRQVYFKPNPDKGHGWELAGLHLESPCSAQPAFLGSILWTPGWLPSVELEHFKAPELLLVEEILVDFSGRRAVALLEGGFEASFRFSARDIEDMIDIFSECLSEGCGENG
ncbi:uncharacterized protein G2W53_032418 [Senna tora]|uniref:Uncharacterized protein n=1 Tax=Senna tora TaxID=362788 RepID=A0A834T0G4_9FABA|nr:uncharacterized protein G2W53_032418 [Senna tora]